MRRINVRSWIGPLVVVVFVFSLAFNLTVQKATAGLPPCCEVWIEGELYLSGQWHYILQQCFCVPFPPLPEDTTCIYLCPMIP